MGQVALPASLTLEGIIAAIGVVAIVAWITLVIAHWKMFEKAGEKGWKSLIPIYSDYTLFKIVWCTKGFWVYYALMLLSGILNAMIGHYALTADGQLMQIGTTNPLIGFLGSASHFAFMITFVVLSAKTAIAYGKGVGFAFGLVLLPNLFDLIIGFGRSEYRGPAI